MVVTFTEYKLKKNSIRFAFNYKIKWSYRFNSYSYTQTIKDKMRYHLKLSNWKNKIKRKSEKNPLCIFNIAVSIWIENIEPWAQLYLLPHIEIYIYEYILYTLDWKILLGKIPGVFKTAIKEKFPLQTKLKTQFHDLLDMLVLYMYVYISWWCNPVYEKNIPLCLHIEIKTGRKGRYQLI